MTFKVISEPKLPSLDDVERGESYWKAKEAEARSAMRQAEDGRARRRYMERISFCEIAAHQAARRVTL